jgi:hypothetical protein
MLGNVDDDDGDKIGGDDGASVLADQNGDSAELPKKRRRTGKVLSV